MQQVITISPEGTMSGLQRKPGQGLNLQKFGHAKTTRASEIVWDEDAQAWMIDVLQDAGKGAVSFAKLHEQGIDYMALVVMAPSSHAITQDWNALLLFNNYDDAVKVEIAYLDALRLKGIF